MYFHRLGRHCARLAAIAALPLLAACLADRELPTTEPTFYRSMAAADAQVARRDRGLDDSGYRSNNGPPR
jgi:hypothetical protein